MTPALPILYSFRRCPYAMRARLAISASGLRVRLREVVLRDKPAELIAATATATVPVLVLPDGRVIDESLAIMHWALGKRDPERWLTTDSDAAADLIAQNDGPFKRALDRYKYPTRYEDEGVDPIKQRAIATDILTALDARIAANGGGLLSAGPSLADMAIFPFIRQFANTDRTWFDAQPLPALQAWLTAHLGSARFEGIMNKYPQWLTGDEEPLFPPA